MGKWGKQKQAKQHQSVGGGGALALYLLQRIKALTAKINFPPPYSFIVGTLFVSPLGPISLAFCLSSCEII